ncbi:MAG: hypothetical protein JST08_01000 [Actinobacteria bacterium]|nr:hypothetical protein [Actinomycetota bacterium]
MKTLATVLVLAAATLALAACGSSGGSTTTTTTEAGGGAPSGGGPVVGARSVPGVGTVLVNNVGKTLYVFAPDNKSEVTCTEACAAVWPPLKTEAGGEAEASGEVKASLLGADPDPEGGEVVTYAGWPLYTYVADTSPGSATGQGVNLNGGYWYVITPAGKIVK